ncbi:MAG: type IV pilus twitching motility protein PilT [Campylobacter sp.]
MTNFSERILSLLSLTNDSSVSDLHVVCDANVCVRKDGLLMQTDKKFDANQMRELAFELLTDKQKTEFLENKELDFAFDVENLARFRANLYFVNGDKIALAIRKIPNFISSLDELKAPQILKDLIKQEKGLILVTGSTGSGKSTLLAAMLNEINLTQNKHIITIEDPVEFVHKNKKSLFSHRNLGSDTKSYQNALKFALRQDPDVILIGEMRDSSTMQACISAAETGHLVLSTLHTNSAPQSINRIIDSFEGSQQNQVRNMLSNSLTAIISQTLVPKLEGGRVSAQEILINTYAVSNLIRENKIHQILSQMQIGQSQTGMITQSASLAKLFENGIISRADAIRFSNNRQEILNLIGT